MKYIYNICTVYMKYYYYIVRWPEGNLYKNVLRGRKLLQIRIFLRGWQKGEKKTTVPDPRWFFFFSKIKKSVLCDFKHNISNDHVSVVCVTLMAERDEINFSNSLKERKKSHYTHCFSKCVSYVCVCVSVSCKSDFLFLNEAHWNSSSELSSIVFSV